MTAALLALLLACSGPEPAPLPAPILPPDDVQARMVRKGAVHGWLARPRPRPGDRRAGSLVLVDGMDEELRARLLREAAAGTVVLAITADVDLQAASAYLGGMPDVATVALRCERRDCTGVPRRTSPPSPGATEARTPR